MPWLLSLPVFWVLLGAIAHANPQVAGSLIGAGVGATVSIAIFLANRTQGRRQTTLELFKEYYSTDFADQRRAAARLMDRFASVDWSVNDPYDLARGEDDLGGYGAVLRYWQRVAILYDEGEVSRRLAQRLLSRELGYWNAVIFTPMANRKDMYVLKMVVELARRFSIGERPREFQAGADTARRRLQADRSGDADATA